MPMFTHDMHQCFLSGAEEAFGYSKDKPTRFLEVGTFEGQTACWMLDNILTHPLSTYDGVEISEERFRITCKNLSAFPNHKWFVLHGESSKELEALWRRDIRYDAIYVDGDHREEEAHKDAVACWNLLSPGGVILFDDYALKESSLDPNVKFNVERAVHRMLSGLPRGSEYVAYLAKNGYQYIVRKV